jgi:hypothetical protein
MPRYAVEVWKTRSYDVIVEADDKDEAKEIAADKYVELSTRDSFVSVEVRECDIDDAVLTARTETTGT